jgi:hypothetical protein
LLVVLVADASQVTMADDAKKAVLAASSEWASKQLQVQTVLYTSTPSDNVSYSAGI